MMVEYIIDSDRSRTLGYALSRIARDTRQDGYCAWGERRGGRMKAARKKLSDRSGQGTTEYVILVGVLVVIAILAITVFRPKLQELWDDISSDIGSSDSGQDTLRETPGGCGEGLSWTVVPGDDGDIVRIEVDGEVVGCIPVEDIANAASTA